MENCSQVIKEKLPHQDNSDYEKIRILFDNICSEIAEHYNLYYADGKPRKAKIIEVIAKSTCTTCIDRELQENRPSRIDNLYRECHQFACNLLVEELYCQLCRIGYTVLIASEKSLECGKVDILIVAGSHDVSLHFGDREIAVEVKTGFSLSLPQLFRYLLDNTDRSLILWRIRNKQVLAFEGSELEPLLNEFMKMIISRGKRLLTSSEISCDHVNRLQNWSPTQQELQEMFSDFVKAVTETLPLAVQAVVKKLEISPRLESN